MSSNKRDNIPADASNIDLLEEAIHRAGLSGHATNQLTHWLATQLENDRFARLERAGHAGEDRIPLGHVFVDLETARLPSSEAGDVHAPKQFFVRVLNEGNQFDEQSFEGSDDSVGDTQPLLAERIMGYALIGGPGQGKSTLGQLICQQHRAWLLRPRVTLLKDHEQINTVEMFSGEEATKDLGKPSTVRFPIRIALSEAAAWLANRKEPSNNESSLELLQYVVEHEKCPISAPDLLCLLAEIDWLIILDGLDEVPASSNRDRLLDSARRLIERMLRNTRHGLLLATTRPQGYSGEFDKLGLKLAFCHLTPLSRERAKIYAERLVRVRFPPDRQQIVLHRLNQAAEGDATARLMRAPLQITILATLVDRIGRAPSEQWTLFREYYRVIYEREMERPFETAELLRLYRSHIDKIHAHVGLLLQVEAENSGGTDSTLSPERFAQVVDAVLTEDDIEGSRRRELVEKLTRAVRDRLVLLVELRPCRLGFEIRSIQEFMGALALSQKNDAVVEARLTQIAKASSFRRVVLFLASKSFTELSDLRDSFTDQICPHLNNAPDDPLARAALFGSILALEILEEGSGLKQPKYVRRLMSLATKLIELPPSQLHQRLARACLSDNDANQAAMPILEKALRSRLAVAIPEQQLGAWAVLVPLVDESVTWAKDLADLHWENHPRIRSELLAALNRARIQVGDWLLEKVQNTPDDISPWDFRSIAIKGQRTEVKRFGQIHAVRSLLRLTIHDFIRVKVTLGKGESQSPLSLRWISISPTSSRPTHEEHWQALAAMHSSSPEWVPWIVTARFILEPSAQTLASALATLSNAFNSNTIRSMRFHTPWPLSTCLQRSSSAEDLRMFSHQASKGQFGDTDDWYAAEKRWKTHPRVNFEEVVTSIENAWPEGIQAQDSGIPAFANYAAMSSALEDSEQEYLSHLRIQLSNSSTPRLRSILADWIMQYLSQLADDGRVAHPPFSPIEFRALLAASQGVFPIQTFCALQSWSHATADWCELLDEVGRSSRIYALDEFESEDFSRYVSDLYRRDPSRVGLLEVLKVIAKSGGAPEVPTELLDAKLFNGERAQNNATFLLLAQGRLNQSEAIGFATRLVKPSKRGYKPASDVLDILYHMPADTALKESVLLSLRENLPPTEWALAATFAEAINTELRHRKSGLDEGSIWDHLRLPLPRPEKGVPIQQSSNVERRPIWIESIHLQNLRSFDELRLTLSSIDDPSHQHSYGSVDNSGQWIAILGENGLGKSTLLRSLVFALIDVTSQPGRLPRSSLDAPWRRRGTGKHEPAIVLVKIHGNSYRTEIKPDPIRSDDSERIEQNPPFLPYPMFAYGCRRGSALGGASRKVDAEPGAELPTLFDEGADLIHAETWLLLRENAALKDKEHGGPAWQLYEEILNAIRDVLPGVEAIEGRNDRIWVQGPRVGEVPLAGLSDGYLTTLGWVVDLIARWIRRAELRAEPIPRDFTKTMTGLVLVDEIDLHLHPEWQLHVIADLRRVFPRMSFVVTTHNPMTLIGLKAEEIWRLVREDGRIVAKQGRERPALMTGSDIYGAYFGIRSVFPNDLGEMLDRYNLLARDPVRSDEEDAEMQHLLAKLQDRGIDPEWKPIQRESIPPYPGGEKA